MVESTIIGDVILLFLGLVVIAALIALHRRRHSFALKKRNDAREAQERNATKVFGECQTCSKDFGFWVPNGMTAKKFFSKQKCPRCDAKGDFVYESQFEREKLLDACGRGD